MAPLNWNMTGKIRVRKSISRYYFTRWWNTTHDALPNVQNDPEIFFCLVLSQTDLFRLICIILHSLFFHSRFTPRRHVFILGHQRRFIIKSPALLWTDREKRSGCTRWFNQIYPSFLLQLIWTMGKFSWTTV